MMKTSGCLCKCVSPLSQEHTVLAHAHIVNKALIACTANVAFHSICLGKIHTSLLSMTNQASNS